MADYRVDSKAVIPVLSSLLPGVLGVQVRSEVAGEVTQQELPPVESVALAWDGYDAYGRFVGGTRKANVQIVLEVTPSLALTPAPVLWVLQPINYHAPFSFYQEPLFTQFGHTYFAGGHGGGKGIGIGAFFSRMLTTHDYRTLGLGGGASRRTIPTIPSATSSTWATAKSFSKTSSPTASGRCRV